MDMIDPRPSVRPDLEGVPETLLWTLWHRALEARRADGVLRDPLAVELVDRIDYPFAERFGDAGALAQWQALRVLAFDREVRRFIATEPGGTVVALGEGLETQFWRVDDGRVNWIGVDLPETVEIRRRLLPDPPRRHTIARSALDLAWMDEVDDSRGVLLTAQGLLMYLAPADVHRLIEACARRFPGAAIVFDAVPRWLAELTPKASASDDARYRPPPWTWWLGRAELRRLEALDGVGELWVRSLPRGRGPIHGFLLPLATRTPGVRVGLLAVLRAGFRTA
jgi:O-methyltransferase involved in polyketide biosynthesis